VVFPEPEGDQELALLGGEADVVDGPELALLEDLGEISRLDDRHVSCGSVPWRAAPIPADGKRLRPRAATGA
jgi:hypothetical protein